MTTKTLTTDFGKFIFLDEHTVVAEANEGVNIDGNKVQIAVNLIESELHGDYAMILDRKADYSVMPVEVYEFFAGLDRLKAIAIVRYKQRDFLPGNMEGRIFKRHIEKFSSVGDAHEWIKNLFPASK